VRDRREKKLLVLLDWMPPQRWQFERILSEFFSVDVLYSAPPKGFNNVFEKVLGLWKSYFLTSLKAASKASQYDIIYSWHAVIGLFTGFWLRLFFIDAPKLVIAQLIIPERISFFNRFFKIPFTKCSLKRIDKVIVYSKVEAIDMAKRYPSTSFVFTPLGIESTVRQTGDENYLFSGGRSNRDYETLFKAVKDLNYSVKIVAQKFNISGLEIPDNVDLYYNVFGEFFNELLANATIVVIPLKRPNESSGQLVLLQAMSYGKTIIVTKNKGLSDYIKHGSEVITVPPHDSEALQAEIKNLIQNPSLRNKLSRKAADSAAQFTQEKQAQRIAKILSDT